MKTKRWIPELGEEYYYIEFVWEIRVCVDRNNGFLTDDERITVDNCFKTKKEATKKLKLIKIILEQP